MTIALQLLSLGALLVCAAMAQTRPRARDLGIPFDGTPGPLNAITDVPGIEVGHTTIIQGDSVRTGVTAIWPRGRQSTEPAFGGWFSLNGNGEMTGTTWLEESGFVDGPVMITNTHSVGLVRDSYIAWQAKQARKPGTNNLDGGGFWSLPIVAETWDGYLNDINGQHVKAEHVVQALEGAKPGSVPEGAVGGGTGMVCYGFKGGIGTSSRVAPVRGVTYHVGVLVQCNCGAKRQLRIAGLPVGAELAAKPVASASWPREDTGSIIIVVATDAPLLPHQAKRLARRASLGLARTGSTSGNGSGDIFIAFSTSNSKAGDAAAVATVNMLPNDWLGPLFEGVVDATEEAIVNAMVAADTMTGKDGHTITALPHDGVRDVLKRYGRLAQ